MKGSIVAIALSPLIVALLLLMSAQEPVAQGGELELSYGEFARDGTVLSAWLEVDGSSPIAIEPNPLFALEKELKYEYTDVDGGTVTVTITYTGDPDKAAKKLRRAVTAMQLVFPQSNNR